jgi:hypothetical protein
MENVVWGEVPAQRTRKQEQFSHPVVTMSAIDKPGAGRKFSFNKAAQTALGIQGEDRISFGFETNGKRIFIRKAEGDAGFQLTKTCTLSDKKTYEFIAKRWDLNSEVENHLAIAMGDSYGELQLMSSTEPTVINTVAEVVEEASNNNLEESVVEEATMPEPKVEEEVEFHLDATADNDPIAGEAIDEDVW